MTLRNSLKYALGLAAAVFASDIKPENKEYHFSPFVQREDVVIPISEIIPLYTDCDYKIYTGRMPKMAKTRKEIIEGVKERRAMEDLWTRYFYEQVSLSKFTTKYMDTRQEWYDPLDGKGEIRDNFNDPRRRGRFRERHEALDIFAPVGTYIRSPVSGVVVAAADDWKGSWNWRKGLHNSKGGFGINMGNGVILFNPIDTSYHLIIHLQDVYVQPGEVVSQGDFLGTVGKTGNAIDPNVPPHPHYVYKTPGKECGVDGVLVARNHYWKLIETRDIFLAQKNGKNLESVAVDPQDF